MSSSATPSAKSASSGRSAAAARFPSALIAARAFPSAAARRSARSLSEEEAPPRFAAPDLGKKRSQSWVRYLSVVFHL